MLANFMSKELKDNIEKFIDMARLSPVDSINIEIGKNVLEISREKRCFDRNDINQTATDIIIRIKEKGKI